MTALIPRADLFGDPQEAAIQISPDGRWLAWLAPLHDVLNIWVALRDNRGEARPVTEERTRGIRFHVWAFDGRHLLYGQDRAGEEDFHVYAVDVRGNVVRDLTPIDGVAAQIVWLSRELPGHVLLGINDRDRRYHDLVAVDLATGARERIEENHGFSRFLTDDLFRVPLAIRFEPGGACAIDRKADGRWRPWLRYEAEDARLSGPNFLDHQGRFAYCSDSRGRDEPALTRIDLATGEETVLLEPAESGVAVKLVDLATGVPLVCVFNRERARYVALDERLQADLDCLAAHGLEQWHVSSRTDDDALWVVGASSDLKPGTTYLYDRAAKRLDTLAHIWPRLEGAPLAPMMPVVIPSRDGLDLVSYLTRPLDHVDDGRGALVLLVHGGPWSRDGFGFHPVHQWLANRGYAVLSVNFRGSTGFGKAFVNAGDGEWGRRMDDDLLDAVAWAIARKIADPTRIGIMGGSYGGYATLVGLTRNPETYACGIDIVGPANLETTLRTTPPYWESIKAQLVKAIGDPDTSEGLSLAHERSPLFKADRIRRPLLIAQGANDPRVKRAESDAMVAAMQANGIPVTYLMFPDEGHVFVRAPNKIAFHAVAEAFLARHLDGRCEGVHPGEIEASTMQVLAGEASVPV